MTTFRIALAALQEHNSGGLVVLERGDIAESQELHHLQLRLSRALNYEAGHPSCTNYLQTSFYAPAHITSITVILANPNTGTGSRRSP